jgi:hypothetical protein
MEQSIDGPTSVKSKQNMLRVSSENVSHHLMLKLALITSAMDKRSTLSRNSSCARAASARRRCSGMHGEVLRNGVRQNTSGRFAT